MKVFERKQDNRGMLKRKRSKFVGKGDFISITCTDHSYCFSINRMVLLKRELKTRIRFRFATVDIIFEWSINDLVALEN